MSTRPLLSSFYAAENHVDNITGNLPSYDTRYYDELLYDTPLGDYAENTPIDEKKWIHYLQNTLKDEGDENDLTNLIFYARHPSLKGQPSKSISQGLKKEWLYIRNKIVRAVYINNKIITLRKGKQHGYIVYAGERVDKTLKTLKKAGRLPGITNDEIEMLKRMSKLVAKFSA